MGTRCRTLDMSRLFEAEKGSRQYREREAVSIVACTGSDLVSVSSSLRVSPETHPVTTCQRESLMVASVLRYLSPVSRGPMIQHGSGGRLTI
jgi:hypothetical protein